jgi:putative selenium metabolism hydrolase
MVMAVDALARAGVKLSGTLVLTGVVKEENAELEGTRYTIEKDGFRPDFALSGEATKLEVALGHRGRMEIDVTTKGKTAHASDPSKGKNAILKMVKVIDAVGKMPLPNHEFLGPTTQGITVVTCRPGTSNVIPDMCTITIDRRTCPEETAERVEGEFRSLLGSLKAEDQELEGEFKLKKNAPPMYISPDHRLVSVLSDSVKEVTGREPKLVKYKFGTDASYLSTIAKIPTAGFGPGDETMAHAPNECVEIEELLTATKVYAIFAAKLLA